MAAGEWVDITGDLRGYYAHPGGRGPHPCVVLHIEAFGVNDHFKRLTERFADAGFAAITPDLYHGTLVAYDDLDNAIATLKSLDDEQVMTETGAALDFLTGRDEANERAAGVIGFCMGGRFTFLANAALADRFRAASSFYGGGIAPVEDMVGRKPLLDRVGAMRAPIQLWYGAEDQSIAPDEIGRIAEALTAAKKRFTVNVFPRVGHGFFCEDRASYDEAAAETAWRETVAFFQSTLAG